jgi:hypothetical protein
MVGDFQNDPVVVFPLFSSDDYDEFTRLHTSRKAIPLQGFLERNKPQFDLLLADEQIYLDNGYKEKFLRRLRAIQTDTSKADMVSSGRAIGDFIVAIDCPKSYVLITYDKLFGILCPALSKEHRLLEKNPNEAPSGVTPAN